MKKHERSFWNYIARVRGRRSHKGNRKRIKKWCAKTQEIDGFSVKARMPAPKSKWMKHIESWI